mgnify:CR=1 FL=1
MKKEFFGLFKYIQRVREEIAAINRPADELLHGPALEGKGISHNEIDKLFD